MSVKNYRFVSPGVFVNEIDNSQTPASPAGIGPVIIGRAAKGPALRPTQVNSFSEFVQVFGNPSPGGPGDDVWREGASTQAPTYGGYTAQAYLRNSSPLTYVRLLGAQTTIGTPTGEGKAGWQQTDAYGLVIFESDGGGFQLTGALAAIFYTNGTPELFMSGAVAHSGTNGSTWSASGSVTGSNVVVGNLGGNKTQFKMKISNAFVTGGVFTTAFNFDINSSKYIRKVFNTNPQLMNSTITDAANRTNYFLGETFDRHLSAHIDSSLTTWAALAKVYRNTSTAASGSDFNANLASAQTPWIIGCDLGDGRAPNLMKFHALDQPGDWTNRSLKISIQDIKQSTNDSTNYGTFTVVVRRLSDSDNVVQVVEQFNNCNLDPNSLNYVARKVGDKYTTWDDSNRLYRERGDWDNRSSFIRVEVSSDVDGNTLNASFLPFGFKGIVKYKDDTVQNGSPLASSSFAVSGSWITGSDYGRAPTGAPAAGIYSAGLFQVSGSQLSASIYYPSIELRVSASDGNLSNVTDAYFGMQTSRTAGGTVYDASTLDVLRPRGGLIAMNGMFGTPTAAEQYSMRFTLDDISGSTGVWLSGSGQAAGSGPADAGTSLTVVNGFVAGVLDAGFDRFTVPLYGGFDGLDIAEMDPFRNSLMNGISNISDRNSYQFNSIRRSIDSVSDPEVVEMNLAAIPGCTHTGLTTNLINVCEDRADALAVIDIPQGYTPRSDSSTSARNNIPSTITSAVTGIRDRGLNSSYACTFYPWVRARDTINGSVVWLPPSVAAIGTFSSSQRKTQVWFAPAGFNRGGLTEGSAGIPVIDVAHQLRRKDRDELYAANINPIAKFPAEGIVIFGQKTLQVTPSALDRINVRRLMIFIKKRISQMASTILFDQNVKTTWARFTSLVEPFLANVQTNFGLTDYKVVLDETTTTPDLIDRNILYAKIFLKPARAIEYIAIDFNITRTGAAFTD